MHGFNNVVNALMGGQVPVDSNSDVGNYGHMDAQDVAPQEKEGCEKLILYLDSGIEIHIPTCVFHKMMNAMNGVEEEEESEEHEEKESPEFEAGEEEEEKEAEEDKGGPLEPDEEEKEEDEDEEELEEKSSCGGKKKAKKMKGAY